MSLFSVAGTVTAIGAGTHHPSGILRDYVEITGDDGRVYNVKYAFVGAQAARGLECGARGYFFFDRVYFYAAQPAQVWKQLYGIKRDNGVTVYDTVSLRPSAVGHHLKIGFAFIWLGLGLIWLTLAIVQFAKTLLYISLRRQAFDGGDRFSTQQVRGQEAVSL